MDRSVGVLVIFSRALFLGRSGIRPNMFAASKMLLCADYVRYIWSRVIRE
jgi:hypothetical protein